VTRHGPGLALVFMFVTGIYAHARGEGDDAPKRRADPEAVKLVEAAQKLIHRPHAAGLRKLTCTATLSSARFSSDIPFAVTSSSPGEAKVRAVLPPDRESARKDLESRYARLVEEYVARPCRGPFGDLAAYHVETKKETPRTVVMTRLDDPEGKARIVATFGKDGLPETIVRSGARGERTEKLRYEKREGGHVEVSRTLAVRGLEAEVEIAPRRISGFWLPARIVFRMPTGDLVVTVTDHVVEMPEKKPDGERAR